MTRISSPIFVGRRREIDELVRAWRRATAGHGTVRLVYGEAGIGKTRLIDELAGQLDPGVVARGRCLDVGEGSLPFGPIVELLRSLPAEPQQGPDADPEVAAALGLDGRRLVQDLVGGVDPDGSPDDGAAQVGQTRLFGAVAEILVDRARRRPRLLVIEDAHWLDAGSGDLVRYLVHALRDEPIGLILTVRTDGLSRQAPIARVLAEIAREPHAGRIDLARFDLDEVAAQVAGILDRPPEPGVVAAVHRRSDGNPFFTEEVVALDVVHGDGVPPSLRDLVLSRLAPIDAATRALLDAAAVGGRWVPDEPLRDVTGLASVEFAAALRTAIAEHFLVQEARPDGSGVAFRHALVRDAVYDDLLPMTRRELHAAWARSFGQGAQASGAIAVAEHYDRAGLPEEARAAYLRAAAAAETVHAYGDALRLRERAIELRPAAERGAWSTAEELVRVAATAEAAGQRVLAIETLIQAVEGLPPIVTDADRSTAILAHRQLAELAIMSGDQSRATASMEAALRLVAESARPEDAGELLASQAMHLQLVGDTAGARRTAEILLRDHGADPTSRAALRARHSLAIADFMDDNRVGDRSYRELAEEATRAGHHDIALHLRLDAAWALVDMGRFAEAATWNEENRRLARALGLEDMVFSAVVETDLLVNHVLGRWPAVEPIIETLTRSARGIPARVRAALHRFAQGRFAEALELVAIARPALHPDGPPGWRGWWATGETIRARIDGRWLEAVDAVERVCPLPCEVGLESELRWVAIQCLNELLAGSRRRSPELVERLMAHLTAVHGLTADPARISPVAVALGRTAEAEATRFGVATADPAGAWATAAAAWARLEIPERLAYCRFREAEARLLGGAARRAAEPALREAHAIAAGLGAMPLLGDIEALARRARIELGSPDAGDRPVAAPAEPAASGATPADPHGLTEREREVLGLVLEGRTNREIGEALFISPKTAGVHVSNILGKLGAVNRVEAATIAHRLGLTDNK